MTERKRLQLPPTTGNYELDTWTLSVFDAVNQLPPVSIFSTGVSGPNSNVTANPGTLGFEQGSNLTPFWIKVEGSGNTGWKAAGAYCFVADPDMDGGSAYLDKISVDGNNLDICDVDFGAA